jgi:hypothetical protein
MSGNWALDDAIAYEQDGAGGTRYVATELGGVSEIAEELFVSRLTEPTQIGWTEERSKAWKTGLPGGLSPRIV